LYPRLLLGTWGKGETDLPGRSRTERKEKEEESYIKNNDTIIKPALSEAW
jgi:hypothetical protein